MKPFNLEQAKQGKPVCYRNGNNTRIICFDKKDPENDYSILSLRYDENLKQEGILTHFSDGRSISEERYDLFMKSEEKTYWINIFRNSKEIFTSQPSIDKDNQLSKFAGISLDAEFIKTISFILEE